jgi:CubicO group peptidase (beta-lactamase class C family)
VAEPLERAVLRRLDALTVEAQRSWRAPAVLAGVVVDGDLAWSAHVGSARLDPPVAPTDDTQVTIGSITKTFTALLVMQLRDEGRLTLDDDVRSWLPETRHAGVTVRQLLSHTSGLQREPVGHLWETLVAPDAEELVARLEDAERVLPGHFAFHYSNLAFAILGLLVERMDGRPWETALRARLLTPLGMTRTALRPADDHALGYQVHPFAGTARPEPALDLRATAPLGGLWSTVADMARYAAFLADPDPAVLRPETVEEMCRPLVMVDPDTWTGAYGLGLGLGRSGDRVYVGHGGAMPGFLSGLRVRRPDRTGAFVAATSTAGARALALATDLVDHVLDTTPTPRAAWVPEQAYPGLDELLGSWWSEGEELVLEVRDGELWMRVPGGTALDDTRFARESATVFRAVGGRERGERLELVRGDDGALTKLYFATYAVTRRPLAFADLG